MTNRSHFLMTAAVLATAALPAAPVAIAGAQQLAGATAARSAAPSPATFWDAIGDTTLQRLVRRAVESGQDVRVAAARVNGARAARVGAALDLAPVVTASSGYSRQRISGAAFPGLNGTLPDQDLWDAGLRLSWELDYAGRLRRAYQGRGALEAASREDVRDVHVALSAQVATAYFALRGAQDQLAVARKNAENQRRSLELTQQRLEAGRGTALDTDRAQAQLSATLAQIPELEATIDAARYRIGVLTGTPATDVESFATTGAPIVLPREVTVERPDSLVRRRPDVRGAERELAASRAFVGSARAEYLPRLAIAGTAGYTASQLDALGRAGTPRYAIGPVLSWPALDLGRVRANVDAARAGEAESRARYEQSVLLALEELETALVRYRKASERLQHLEDAAAASERAAELARLQFEEGGADFLRVLDAERTMLDAQDRLAQGRTEATTRLVAVYRSVGGEWPGAR